jgi:hypothetical protein
MSPASAIWMPTLLLSLTPTTFMFETRTAPNFLSSNVHASQLCVSNYVPHRMDLALQVCEACMRLQAESCSCFEYLL